MGDTAPLILTLTLDPPAQARFDALRAAHFPADRLFIGAHVTLFHALPNDLAQDVIIAETRALSPFTVSVNGLRFLGRGVAYSLESAPLRKLRNRLRQHWLDHLTPQDRQGWQPHVTIQNKADPAAARALHVMLSAGFSPWQVTATGLDLWIYRNGPWEAAATFPFGAGT